MHKRYVLWNNEDGIYLGNCMGFGFWSQLDPAGQDAAVTFESETQALDHVLKWDEQFPVTAVVVFTADPNYASIEECVAAGLPRWDPNQPVLDKEQ